MTGPTGPPGTYYIQTTFSDTGSQVAICDPGDIATGGGYRSTDPATVPHASHPFPYPVTGPGIVPIGWQVEWLPPPMMMMEIFVICADVSSGV